MKDETPWDRWGPLLFAVCPRCNWPKFIHDDRAPIRCDNPHCGAELERMDFQPYERTSLPPRLRA